MAYGTTAYGRRREGIPQATAQPTGLGNLLDLLNMPGDYGRGVLAGRAGERLTGQEFNEQAGFGDSALAGFATEVVLDPLNLVALGPLTKAGRAVSNAGRLGRAGEYLSKAAQAGRASAPIAERARKAAARAGRSLDDFSAVELAGKPLVRPRAATRFGTPRQIAAGMDNADDAAALLKKAKGVEDLELSKDIGLGLPFMRPFVSGNLPGGAFARDILDSAVLATKFGAPGRYFRSAFDGSAGGVLDEAEQVFATGSKILGDEAVARETAKGTASAAKLMRGDQSAFTEQGGRELGDAIEGAPVPGDASAPVRDYADWWQRTSQDFLDRSRRAGVSARERPGYLPRIPTAAAEDAFLNVAKHSPNEARLASPFSGDQMARAEYMPELTSDVIRATTDPDLVGPNKLPFDEAVQKVYREYFGDVDGAIDEEALKKASQFTRLLSGLNPEDIPKGLFAEHPTKAITTYMKNRGRAIENAKNIGEYIATKAVRATDNVAREPHVTVAEALKASGLERSGDDSFQAIREIIARKTGQKADDISLTDYVVPQSISGVASRSTQLATKGMPGPLLEAVDYVNKLWRNSILAFPARYFRDLTGGVFVNFLESAQSLYGADSALKVLRGRALDAPDFLRRIPRYANTADDTALVAQFYSDLAATGLADGALRYDMGVSDAVRTTLPGVDSIAPNFGRMANGAVGRKGRVPNLLNPSSDFYKETSALNNFVDVYNRLSGYMELLRQGVDPVEAGMRMKRAHVDYSGLTDFEQKIRKLLPFYTYTSRIAQETGRKLVEQPRRLVTAMRGIEAAPEIASEFLGAEDPSEGYIPRSYRERVAIPLSSDSGGKTILYGADFPGIDTLNTVFGDRPEQLISGVSPLANYGIETLTGRDTFTGQPLNQKRTALGRVVGGDNDLTRAADRLLELGPVYPRAGRLLADLVEPRSDESLSERALQTGVNALTGARIRRLDNDQLRQQAIYELEDATDPFARTYETSYIPDELLETLTPQQQRQWEVLQQLRQAKRKARQDAR